MGRPPTLPPADELEKLISSGQTNTSIALMYGVDPSAISKARRRAGKKLRPLHAKKEHNRDLLPWKPLAAQHKNMHTAQMLRLEGRRRRGEYIKPWDLRALENWKATLRLQGLVIHYDPRTEQGWFRVKPRPGVDVDLIRRPEVGRAPRRLDV